MKPGWGAAALVLAAVAVRPTPAEAAVAVDVAWTLAGALCVAVAAALLLAWRLHAAHRRAARRLNALRDAPDGLLWWDAGRLRLSDAAAKVLGLHPGDLHPGDLPLDRRRKTDSGGICCGGDSDPLAAAFAGTDGAAIAEAATALRRNGQAFDLAVTTRGGRALLLRGRRTNGEALIWIDDRTAAARAAAEAMAQAAKAEAGGAVLQQVLDALPVPVWWRHDCEGVAGSNATYAGERSALEDGGGNPLSDQGSAGPCSGEPQPPPSRRANAHPQTRSAVGRPSAAALAVGPLSEYMAHDGRQLAARATKTGMAQSESHHVLVDGARRLFEITEAPLAGTAAGDSLTVGFATDLTALETIQSELATHVAVQGELLEALASAIAIFGADRRLRFFNGAFVDLWQIERRQLEHRPRMDEFLELLRDRRRLPEMVDFQAYKQDVDALFNNLIEPREELMHLPDERTLRVVTTPHPMGGLIQICEDVTDRLALERSYNTLIAVQQETLNHLYEAIIVFGSDGRLKLWNRSAVALWGLDEGMTLAETHIGDLLERTRRYFAAPDDWSALKERLVLAVTEPEARSGRLERTDGKVLDFSCVPLPDGACMVGYIDVTDSVHVQRALEERNLALETADRVKSEFIANVSYELRTPLNAIIGFTEILENRYFGELSPRQGEYVSGILQASRHLMSLINDILDLATIEAGYMALELKAVSIYGLLSGLLKTFQERAVDRGLTIDVDCLPDIGTIVADERRLRQAIYNVLSNAMQFTPAGGRVAVSAMRTDAELIVVVTDTGVGIPAEDVDRMMEKFERADPHARESGPGLGLALVKSLVELHGGTVRIVSDSGMGTTVECRLPTVATAPLQQPFAIPRRRPRDDSLPAATGSTPTPPVTTPQ